MDQVDKVNQAVQFSPGVIVAPHAAVVYYMNPRGGIDAAALSSGKLLWSTDHASKPLLLYHDLLIAQAEVSTQRHHLSIAVIPITDFGKNVRQFDVPISPGVHASVDDHLGASFRVSARMDDDDIIISWDSHQQPVSHMVSATDARSKGRSFSGIARINLRNGSIENVDPDELPNALKHSLPDKVTQLMKTENLHEPPWHVGSVLAAISRNKNGSSRVVLKRWHYNSGDSMPTITLFDDGRTIRERSVDGRYILASRLARAGDDTAEAYVWSLFSLETGARVAEFGHPSPSGRFLIVGSTMLEMLGRSASLTQGKWVAKPLRLQATSIDTGTNLWVHPIRDTSYRGPYPPTKK